MGAQDKAIELSKKFGLTNIAPDLDFRGKTVLVTGGAAGIGEGVSRMAHLLGANVIAIDVQEQALRKIEDDLGERMTGLLFDLSSQDPADYQALAKSIVDASPNGVVDSYIMNAGVVKLSRDSFGVSGTDAKELRTVMQINAWSHGDIFRAIHSHLADDARIVVTTSPIVGRADPKTPGYAISKQALESVANQILGEVEDTDIIVTGYVPPPVQNFLRTDLKPNEPWYAHPQAQDMAELPLRLASSTLMQKFNGVVIAMGYDHLRDKTGQTEDGNAFDFMPRDPETNGFIYDLRTRMLASGGGDDGRGFMHWDTDSCRLIQGAGRTPDMVVGKALTDEFDTPDHVLTHRPS